MMDYYLGAPDIQKMVFLVISDGDARSQALLNHDVLFGEVLPEYMDQVEADADLTIVRARTNVAYYIQFNVEQLPRDLRYAIAHSLNYSYYIKEITGDDAFELHTPIPEGMLYHNASIEGLPYFNITKAREILLESSEASIISALTAAGLDSDSTDAEWHAAADSANPLYDLNFSRYQSTFVGYIEAWMEDNIKALGIKLHDDVIGDWGLWSEWVNEPGNKDKVLFTFSGWSPDYNSPINMLEPIFKTDSEYNDMNLADPTLDALMASTYSATPTEQAEIFQELQEMIAVDLVPCTYIEQGMSTFIYNSKMVGNIADNLNILEHQYFYNINYPLDANTGSNPEDGTDDDGSDENNDGSSDTQEPPALPVIPGYSPMILLSGIMVIILFYKKDR